MKPKTVLKAFISGQTILAIIAVFHLVIGAVISLLTIRSLTVNPAAIPYFFAGVVLILASIGVFKAKAYGWYVFVVLYQLNLSKELINVLMLFKSPTFLFYQLYSSFFKIILYVGLLIFFYNEKTRSSFEFQTSRKRSVLMSLIFTIFVYVVLTILRQTSS